MNKARCEGYVERLREIVKQMRALPEKETMLYEAAVAALDTSLLNLRNSVDVLREAERNVENLIQETEKDVARLTQYAKPESET